MSRPLKAGQFFRELPRADWKVCFPQTLRGAAQKWYFNYPPVKLPTYKQLSKALVKRFKDEKSDEELLSQLGKIKQKKASVHSICRGHQGSGQTIIFSTRKQVSEGLVPQWDIIKGGGQVRDHEPH